MALTELQRTICQLIAQNRIESGESYVAGGVALNEALGASRISRDIDLFHDTHEALEATWAADRKLLEERGFHIEVIRELRGFVQVSVQGLGDSVKMEWVRDSAYRFFPLRLDASLGVTLHPFDPRSHYSDSESRNWPLTDRGQSERELSQKWRAMIEDARGIVNALPPPEAGKAVLLKSGGLCRDPSEHLRLQPSEQRLHFHQGRVRGALPSVVQE